MNKPNITCFLVFLLVGVFLSGCATFIAAPKKSKLKRAINQNEVLQKHFVGFGLYDPLLKEYLYEKNTDKYFTPASNTKILTYYASIKTLGDSIEALKYTFRNDSLFIKGMGDPLFLNPEFKHQPVYNFLKNIPDSIQIMLLDDEITNRFGPGWAWDDYLYGFQPELSAFPIHGNYVSVQVRDNEIQTNPAIFKNLVEIDTNGNHRKHRSEAYNYFIVSSDTAEKKIPFRTSGKLTVDILRDTLGRDVKLSQDTSIILNLSLFSLPKDSLLIPMMKRSDNFYAEQLLLMCAQRNGFGWNTESFMASFKKKDLKHLPAAPNWRDGSGLSRYNLITPGSLIKVLESIYHEVGMEKIKRVFPVGGKSGTIKNWYAGTKPYVYAKTGTLSNNHNISGFLVTNSGRVLIFSFMNNNYVNGSGTVKKEIQKTFELIRDIY